MFRTCAGFGRAFPDILGAALGVVDAKSLFVALLLKKRWFICLYGKSTCGGK